MPLLCLPHSCRSGAGPCCRLVAAAVATGHTRLLTALGGEILEVRYVSFSEGIAKSWKVGPCAPHLAVRTRVRA